jgi:hypothetical protein
MKAILHENQKERVAKEIVIRQRMKKFNKANLPNFGTT